MAAAAHPGDWGRWRRRQRREEEEAADPMRALENRTLDSRRQMDTADAASTVGVVAPAAKPPAGSALPPPPPNKAAISASSPSVNSSPTTSPAPPPAAAAPSPVTAEVVRDSNARIWSGPSAACRAFMARNSSSASAVSICLRESRVRFSSARMGSAASSSSRRCSLSASARR